MISETHILVVRYNVLSDCIMMKKESILPQGILGGWKRATNVPVWAVWITTHCFILLKADLFLRK